jgi:hypothetical protein
VLWRWPLMATGLESKSACPEKIHRSGSGNERGDLVRRHADQMIGIRPQLDVAALGIEGAVLRDV